MKEKKLKLTTEILAILVICLISFVGVYKQSANKIVNQVKDYDLSKDFSGYREFVFEVSDAKEVTDSDGKVVGDTDSLSDTTIESNSYQKTETKINTDEDLNEQNYNKAKKIIEARLKKLNVQDYNISVNKENGSIYLQIPENTETDHIASNILQVADFKIKDSEDTSKVFLTNDDLKKVSAIYNTTTSGTTVYLQMELNKNGKNILKDLSSGEYATKEETDETEDEQEDAEEDENLTGVEAEVSTEESENTDAESAEKTENTEESEDSEETAEDTQKKIIISIDGNDMITTSFDDPIEDGMIYLSMGQASTDSETISSSLKSTSTISVVLNSGKMPITYKISEDQYVNTDISTETIKYVVYSLVAIIAILVLFLIIKHKSRGAIAAIAYIGFAALYLLAVRYTNIAISLESIVALAIILIINYITTCKLLKINETDKELKKIAYNKALKSTILELIPVFIISIIFVFIKWISIATFGMFIFWGIVLSIIYNYILTKDMLD